jgi:hypothetical protein
MKLYKSVLILFISVLFTYCSGDDTEVFIDLSNSTLSDTYSIKSLNEEIKEVATSAAAGTTVDVSTTSSIGDTFFEIDFVINANGTYTASGSYRMVSSIKPNGGDTVMENIIVSFDTAGTYTTNKTENTVTFSPNNGEFLKGEFNVLKFNETTVTLTQEVVEVNDPITNTINRTISLTRLD